MNISIINAPLAAGADVVTSGNNVTITGLSGFDKTLIASYNWIKSRLVTPQVWAGSATAVIGNTYRFGVQIVVNGIINNYDFTFTATTTNGSDIDNAIKAWVSSKSSVFGTTTVITSSNSGTGCSIVISGSATRPMVTAYEAENVTITYNMPALTGCTTTGAPHTAGLPVIVTKAAHGLLTGTLVDATGFDGGAAVLNGLVLRVVWASSSTFTLETLDGTQVVYGAAVTEATTGTITSVASESFGAPADVTADAVANGSQATATVTGYHYNCLQMVLTYPNSNPLVATNDYPTVRVWYPYNIDTAATTIYTNAASLQTALAGVV